MRPTLSPQPRGRRALALMAALGVALAGCSSAGTSESSDAAQNPVAGAPDKAASDGAGAPAEDRAGAVTTGGADGPSRSLSEQIAGRQIARTASVALTVADLDAASTALHAAITTAGGTILDETRTAGEPWPTGLEGDRALTEKVATGTTTVTAQVPSAALDRVVERIGDLGTLIQRATTSSDVTSQVIDTTSRLATMKASIDRVRALMAQAKDIGQVVTLEGELSRREAELESLQSMLAALKDQVAMSTVTVTMSTTAAEEAADDGFLAGLAGGWSAFTAALVGGLTVLGAATPFMLFALLFAIPVWRFMRRRNAPAAPNPGPSTTQTGPSAAATTPAAEVGAAGPATEAEAGAKAAG
jgi:hypothetical protein